MIIDSEEGALGEEEEIDFLRYDDSCSKINGISPIRVEGHGQKARNRGVRKCTGAQTVIEDAFFKKFEIAGMG